MNPSVTTPENESAEDYEREPVSAGINAAATPAQLRELIARQPFFKGLNSRQIGQLAGSALLMKFAAGQQIFNEADPANRFYIILEGRVALESEGRDAAQLSIQTLGPGEDLGWSWLFAPYYLHFGARAIEPTSVLFFYGPRVRQQCEEDHDLGYELTKRVGEVVVKRLEITRQKLMASTGMSPGRD